MKALVTRPEPDASAFAALCRANDVMPISAPLMDIKIAAKRVDLDGIGALAFTSANGVRAFAKNNSIRDLMVFVVGPATAEAARAEGFVDIHMAGGDVDALAQIIAKARGLFNGAVLHVAGTDRAGNLLAMLGANNVPARRAVLYEARAVSELPASAKAALSASPPVEWAAFFSPRTAKLFVSLARAAGQEDCLAHIQAACLSEAVAEAVTGAAGDVRWKSINVASSRDAEGVIALMRGATSPV